MLHGKVELTNLGANRFDELSTVELLMEKYWLHLFYDGTKILEW